MASNFGYDFAAEDGAAAQSWRMTGRDEGKAGLPLAPWGWGKDFDEGKLPSGLQGQAPRSEKGRRSSLWLGDSTVYSVQSSRTSRFLCRVLFEPFVYRSIGGVLHLQEW